MMNLISPNTTMKAFDTYPGGKGGAGVYQTIINQQPPHDTYIEAFLGGGAVLRAKRPAALNIGLDRSQAVIDAWHLALSSDPAMQKTLRIELGCAIEFLSAYRWTGRELVYIDPPYVRSARRSSRDLYDFEMTDDEHRRLLQLCRDLPCSVQISGYPSDLYAEMLADWRLIRFQAQTRSGTPAEECLWMNYAAPVALHDYRHLGASFRERERIKRKATRWAAGLARLPALERQAVLSAMLSSSIAESGEDDVAGSDDKSLEAAIGELAEL